MLKHHTHHFSHQKHHLGNSRNINMLEGSILPKLLLYALPIMLSSILQLLYNAADIIVVGRFNGPESLAAVGSTTSLIHLQINLFLGLSVGTRVLIARLYGAGDKKGVNDASHTAVLMSIISGVFLSILGNLLSTPMLNLMDTPSQYIHLADMYLKIYFLSMPAAMLINFATAILGAVGDTRRPMYIMAISGVLNVVLNIFFVTVIDMNVAGVALATTISQYASAAALLYLLIKTDDAYKITISKLKIHFAHLKSILACGIPAGIQSTVFSISNVIIQGTVNGFGVLVVAGSSAAANIEGFLYVGMDAIAQSNMTFISQNLGANKYKRIGRINYISIGVVAVIGIFLSLIVTLFGKQLVSLYTSDAAVIPYGILRLTCICTLQFTAGVMNTVCAAMRGIGKALISAIISVFGICVIRVMWITIGTSLGIIDPNITESIKWLFISYPATWIITGGVQFIWFLAAKRRFKTKASL